MKDVSEKVNITKETLEDIGKQIVSMLEGLSAKIDDYKFSVVSSKGETSIEFFIKALFKHKKKK